MSSTTPFGITGTGTGPYAYPGGPQIDAANRFSDNLVFTKERLITSAQLLAFHHTYPTLLAAPGANLALIFRGATVFYDWDGTTNPYVVDTDVDIEIRYTDSSGLLVAQIEAVGFLDQVADKVRYVRPFAAASGASDITPVANAALVIGASVADPTGGTSPLKLRVQYTIIRTDLSYIS